MRRVTRAAAWAALGAVAVMGAPAPAQAAPWAGAVFSQCDGFGMPTKSGDGMTGYAMVLGIFNPPGYGTTARADSASGEAGEAACDAALASDQLAAEHWMRRVNLLKARALHRLERGDAASALKDLELADAAAKDPTDPFYVRSLGLGLDLVRTYALRQVGDGDKGVALAEAAVARRPFTRTIALSALIALGPAAETPQGKALTRSAARLEPSFVNDLFIDAVEARRWSEVVDLYPQQFTPRSRRYVPLPGGGGIDEDYVDRIEAEEFWAVRSGAYAYALAALGQTEEARAALAAAEVRLQKALEPLPEPAALPPTKNAKKAAREAAAREQAAQARAREDVRIGRISDGRLAEWRALIENRILITEADAVTAATKLTGKLPRGPIGLDMIVALRAKAPASDKPLNAALAAAEAELRAVPPAPPEEADVSTLFRSLPDAETAKRLTPYKVKNNTFLFGTIDGFTVAPLEQPEEWGVPADQARSVTFRGVNSPAAVVEEMAMLRAADMALSDGKRGFIILNRNDIAHSTTTTYYGAPVRTDPMGYETRLDVLLVDPANLPERLSGAGWRVLDAEAVRAALAPIYVQAEARKKR